MKPKRKTSESRIKKVYYGGLIFYLIFLIIMLFAIIMCIINKKSFENTLLGNLLFYGLIIAFSSSALFFLCGLIKYSKDYKAMKKGQFEEITGIVISYVKNVDELGKQSNNFANIKDCNSEKVIRLNVERTKKNQTYVFIYLKHTRIGAVKTSEGTDGD